MAVLPVNHLLTVMLNLLNFISFIVSNFTVLVHWILFYCLWCCFLFTALYGDFLYFCWLCFDLNFLCQSHISIFTSFFSYRLNTHACLDPFHVPHLHSVAGRFLTLHDIYVEAFTTHSNTWKTSQHVLFCQQNNISVIWKQLFSHRCQVDQWLITIIYWHQYIFTHL